MTIVTRCADRLKRAERQVLARKSPAEAKLAAAALPEASDHRGLTLNLRAPMVFPVRVRAAEQTIWRNPQAILMTG